MDAFDVQNLEKGYAFIDELSEDVFMLVLDQLTGNFEERAEAVGVLQASLLRGKLPAAGEMLWPSQSVVEAVFGFLELFYFVQLVQKLCILT